MIAGFLVLWRAWPVLWEAQREGELAATGLYSRVRHPQYAGFLLIMIAFLVQWPTLVTIGMFPVLAFAYRRLALTEEREMRRRFGTRYDDYAAVTPRLLPRLDMPTCQWQGDRSYGRRFALTSRGRAAQRYRRGLTNSPFRMTRQSRWAPVLRPVFPS